MFVTDHPGLVLYLRHGKAERQDQSGHGESTQQDMNYVFWGPDFADSLCGLRLYQPLRCRPPTPDHTNRQTETARGTRQAPQSRHLQAADSPKFPCKSPGRGPRPVMCFGGPTSPIRSAGLDYISRGAAATCRPQTLPNLNSRFST